MKQAFISQAKGSKARQVQETQMYVKQRNSQNDPSLRGQQNKSVQDFKKEIRNEIQNSLNISSSFSRSPRIIQSQRDMSSVSLRHETSQFEKGQKGLSAREKDQKQALNLQARLMISSKKIIKLQQELHDKEKDTLQLESQFKKQAAQINSTEQEYEAKLQRNKEQIYKYQCENEKLVAQIQSTGNYKEQLSKISFRAEESDKSVYDLRKVNKVLQEQINYLKYQNQELLRQTLEAQSRYDQLAQTSAEFMRRTKEIVGNNKGLQHLLLSVID